MRRNARVPATADLLCEVCGRLPEPAKTRLTLAQVATILPIELLVHALVVGTHLPFLIKVAVLTVTATLLVIWVAEPSVKRLLRGWLHAPALRGRRRLDDSPALWRVRTTLPDMPGALQRMTRVLARADINILSIHSHLVDGGALDEFVLEAPEAITEQHIVDALENGGGRDSGVWSTTALALADGQTRVLSIAARIAGDSTELPLAIAEMLGARVTDGATVVVPDAADRTTLKVPTTDRGPMIFSRPGEPFTLAESARAHRLAELAEIVELTAATRNRRA
ncbi:ACT domain-containing protein [Salinibacterium sp. ZJ454]|uniref:ACT domain-containing protein n=1 Tax=Salinibacterium sp. ZJ454 TaxID=2708339 RepID=UPI0014216DDD|nr:ACT domain-containing protein [Salinibacterium sp. ZJ454]